MEVGLETAPCSAQLQGCGAQAWPHGVDLGGQGRQSLTAMSVFQDPGASFDANDQDPDPQPRYTQMNDNR